MSKIGAWSKDSLSEQCCPVLADQQTSSHREETKKLKAFALKLKKELAEMKEKVENLSSLSVLTGSQCRLCPNPRH